MDVPARLILRVMPMWLSKSCLQVMHVFLVAASDIKIL